MGVYPLNKPVPNNLRVFFFRSINYTFYVKVEYVIYSIMLGKIILNFFSEEIY